MVFERTKKKATSQILLPIYDTKVCLFYFAIKHTEIYDLGPL